MFKKVAIFSGNANPELTQEICQALELPLGKSKVSRFSDGETFCEIDENVRGVDAYVIQPTCSPGERQRDGAAHHGRRAPPRLGRLDHRGHPVLRLRAAGPQGRAAHAHHVASSSPTSSSPRASTASSRSTCTPGRSRASSTSPSTTSSRCRCCSRTTCSKHFDATAVIVSPDAGGVERARAYSKRLGGTLAIIDKRRERANESEVMNLIGEVEGQALHHHRRHHRHRRHAGERGQRADEGRRARASPPARRHAGPLRARPSSASRRVAAHRGHRDRHHPALATRRRPAARSRSSASRASSARPSSASTTRTRSAPSSSEPRRLGRAAPAPTRAGAPRGSTRHDAVADAHVARRVRADVGEVERRARRR